MIRAYQECCAEVVQHWAGHVAKYMGDCVLAHFGWPHAHKDRAGLDLTESVRKLDTPAGEMFETQIGIATGLHYGGRDLIHSPGNAEPLVDEPVVREVPEAIRGTHVPRFFEAPRTTAEHAHPCNLRQ